jgi:hypothetical protein
MFCKSLEFGLICTEAAQDHFKKKNLNFAIKRFQLLNRIKKSIFKKSIMGWNFLLKTQKNIQKSHDRVNRS